MTRQSVMLSEKSQMQNSILHDYVTWNSRKRKTGDRKQIGGFWDPGIGLQDW